MFGQKAKRIAELETRLRVIPTPHYLDDPTYNLRRKK